MSVYTTIYLGLYGMGTFPQVNLGVACELGLAGTWTDVTGWALQEGTPLTAFTITRGRGNEITSATPGACSLKLNNVDGRFSPRNPVGPYYGKLVRNTPLRISVPAAGTALRLEGDSASGAQGTGIAGITGDVDVRLEMWLTNWMPCSLAAQYPGWSLVLNGDGTLGLIFDVSSVLHVTGSTMPVPPGHTAIRFTRAASTGVVTFYTSTAIGGSWTQLGSAVTAQSGSLTPGTTVTAGYEPGMVAFGFAGANGLLYDLQVYSGIAGTLEAEPKFSSQAAGTSNWTDAQSNSWATTGTAAIDGRSYRFHGECSALPQSWDVTGHDAWTPVTAGGPLRRLQQGNTPLQSVMRRAITYWPSVASSAVAGLAQSTIAYWPCEDPAGSAQIAAGIAVNTDGNPVPPMAVAGSPAFQGTSGSPSADAAFACSAQLPQAQGSTWTARVPSYSTADTSLLFLLQVPSGGIAANGTLVTINLGSPYTFQLWVQYLTTSNGSLRVALAGGGSSSAITGVNGVAMWVEVTACGGGFATAYLNVYPLAGSAIGSSTVSIASLTGNMTSIIVNPLSQALGATIMGHFWVSAGKSSGGGAMPLDAPSASASFSSILNAWTGETAGNRVARLATENGYASRVYGYPATTQVMGPQAIDTLFNLLTSCEDADRGQLFEPRQVLAIGYRTLASLTAQPAAVTLSVTADEVSPPLDTLDDDQFLRNDVTVTRSGGSAATATVTSGALSVNPPPSGAGDYSTSLTTYVQLDTQLPDIAGWMAHVGTADAERFPSVSVDLASTDAALQAILPSVRDADIGSYVTITGLSSLAWMPPGATTLLIWGTAETLGDFAWSIAWNAVPEIPYEVALSDDTVYGRADTDGSTLHANITSGATSMQVDTTNAASPLWTTSAGDFPFDILMSGEQITVTNITGSSSPQTFTITRGVNGVTKAQTAGTSLALYHAPVAALI